MAYSDRFAETTPQDEIFIQIGLAAAVGTAAPSGIKYGIDPVTGERLYVDNSGDWQLVPSAAVTPEPLANGEETLAADIDLSVANQTIYEDVVSVTVPNTGRYLLTGLAIGTINGGDDIEIWASIADNTNANLRAGNIQSAANVAEGSSYVESGTTNILHYVDATAGDTFKLRATQNTNTTQNLIRAGSSLSYQQIPTSTVANPGGSTTIQSGTTPDPGGVGADLRTVTFPTSFTTVPSVTANAVDVPELTGGMTVNIVSKSTTNFTYVIKRIPDNAPHGKWHAINWIAVE